VQKLDLTNMPDLSNILTESQTALTQKVESMLEGVLAQVAAKFVPGVGWVTSLYNGLTWLINHQQQLTGVIKAFTDSLNDLADGKSQEFQDKLVGAMNGLVGPLLNMAMTQFGLGQLPQQLKQAVSFIPKEVDQALKAAIAKLAAAVKAGGVSGGTNAALFTGKVAQEQTFSYQGQNYVLWVAQENGTTKVKVAKQTGGGYQLVATINPTSLLGNHAAAVFGTLASDAQALYTGAKPIPGRTPTKNTMPALMQLQQKVVADENLMKAAIQASACAAVGTGCIAAGTKLLTRAGWQAVENIRHGDSVLARDEYDPMAEPDWKAVEATFRRTGRILHLHVGGQVFRTTPEHPFYASSKGWTAAGALQPGDRIATLSGEWTMIEEVFDTGLYEPVYNLRVADWHTYFVGDDHWGWAAWAHNTYAFLSGLQVAQGVMQQTNTPFSLTNAMQNANAALIINGIRNAGKYGLMGDQGALVSLLTYELQSGGGVSPDPGKVLTTYQNMACVQQAMLAENDVLKSNGGLRGSATPPGNGGKEVTRWTAYIYRTPTGSNPGYSNALAYRAYRQTTGLGDVDARGVSFQGAQAQRAALPPGDEGIPNPRPPHRLQRGEWYSRTGR
jgi:hypothetical protein